MTAAIDKRATRWMLEQLVAGGLLELAGDDEADLARLVDEATAWLVENVRDPRRAPRFASFLVQHPSVAETFADDELLAERLAAWESAVRRFAPASPHRDPALEAQICDAPDDDALRLVYGDWLQQHGDPLGELIVRAGSNERAAKRLLSERSDYFFGPASEYLRLFKLDYHLGMIRSLAVTRARATEIEWGVVTGWLLERPIARFVEHVQIGPLASTALDPELGVWNALLREPRPALRTLAVTGGGRPREPIDLALLVVGAPRLEELRVRDMRVCAEVMELPALRRLELGDVFDTRRPSLATALHASSWPALEELDVTAGSAGIGPIASFLPVDAPNLRRLRLLVEDGLGGVRALAEGRLLPRLVTLELCGLEDDGGRAIVANIDRFAHLQTLVLSHHELARDTLRQLSRRVRVEVVSDDPE